MTFDKNAIDASLYGMMSNEATGERKKKSKAAVHYRDTASKTRNCGTCSMFSRTGAGGEGKCSAVSGVIRAADVCDLWEKK
jgi:hypothetical protein